MTSVVFVGWESLLLMDENRGNIQGKCKKKKHLVSIRHDFQQNKH